ncbi:peptidoglycan-binding protein [Paracoccus sp. R86501]|uniref:peptidoglycan-binding protein n=1 Tax=Paracoccus sp. R86501 TaxID=3101711 RepID=UPI00366ADEF7
MRQLAVMVLAAALPGAAMAQDALIRLEAKRAPDVAATTAAGWAEQFDDVVTLPLKGGWTGIALGPMDREAALARLADLKAKGVVPGDAFVTEPAAGTELTPLGDAPEADDAPAQPEVEADDTAAEPVAEPVSEPAPQGSYLQLESFQDRAEADEALTRNRKEFPGAGLWELPNGWFTVALGPVADEVARDWLPVLKSGKLIPRDALVTQAADLGQALDEGKEPALGATGDPEPMPPLDQVQRALRWAGHYDGQIDGRDGPKTQGAIQAEILSARASTDPGAAMRLLEERRAEWRDDMGLAQLDDEATGLSVMAPMGALQFDRSERALSIYGPKDGSGAAMILFSQPGGQQELLDLAGLVTALGWVPQPERDVQRGHVILRGENDDHIGAAEGWVRDGRAEGFVLIWPTADQQDQARILAEISDSLTRKAPGHNEDMAPAALPGEPAATP